MLDPTQGLSRGGPWPLGGHPSVSFLGIANSVVLCKSPTVGGVKNHPRLTLSLWICPGNFRQISRNCPGSFLEISWICPRNFPDICRKCSGNFRIFPGYFWNFQGMSRKFPKKILEISRTCPGYVYESSRKFLEIS